MRVEIQKDSMDSRLINKIWSALDIVYWRSLSRGEEYLSFHKNYEILFTRMWISFFCLPLDTLSHHIPSLREKLREKYFKFKWNEVLDFIEFIADNFPDDEVNRAFMNLANQFFESELSAYRFVNGQIIEMTSDEERREIEEALKTPVSPVRAHLGKALTLLDRKSPDYSNSIKESISAVEAICQIITGKKSATLGQAIKAVEGKVQLHPALKTAFPSLYGYTSDADGIRHALLDEPNLGFDDAKYFLVSCSAFINYLISKSAKAGLVLNEM